MAGLISWAVAITRLAVDPDADIPGKRSALELEARLTTRDPVDRTQPDHLPN